MKVLEKAFQLLFTTKGKGTGLGLSLCRRIMNAHGGSIHIRSRPGKGTEVQLELPKPPSEDRSS